MRERPARISHWTAERESARSFLPGPFQCGL